MSKKFPNYIGKVPNTLLSRAYLVSKNDSDMIDDSNFEQIILPANEYAHVVSEINTNLTNEE